MSDPIVIVLPGVPVAKGRPAVRVIRTADGRAFPSVYKPADARKYEKALAWAAKAAMRGRAMTTGPVSVVVTAVIPVPASWSNRKRDAALAGSIMPTGKPDIDNYQKSAFDGLRKVVWNDDAQVVSVQASKLYGEEPLLRIEVREHAPGFGESIRVAAVPVASRA
jgi:Holliday junction resolvase RusA-like endonuclease